MEERPEREIKMREDVFWRRFNELAEVVGKRHKEIKEKWRERNRVNGEV